MNYTKTIDTIVILGGGTAGWMTAAALSQELKHCQIYLIESAKIGTIGVGEATIPHLKQFNDMLGINEKEFIKTTKATFKLGIKFKNWGEIGANYFHPFGQFGHTFNDLDFHHFYLEAQQRNLLKSTNLDDYSFAAVAAKYQKFCFPNPDINQISATYGYAYHIDEGLYAQFLRQYSEKNKVKRIEGEVKTVIKSPNGNIQSLQLSNGEKISAQLFIDCSGFRGVLIEQSLQAGYHDWSEYLLCDRAVTVASERLSQPAPYSIANAQSAGWAWQIPLQHRTGNGYVYSSQHIQDRQAEDTLLNNLTTSPCSQPRMLKFNTGVRRKIWDKNCVAIGLAAGFLEPLESTGIYLIQQGIIELLRHFPRQNFEPLLAKNYNNILHNEFTRIRDFLILHYTSTQRRDSMFWREAQQLALPDTLSERIELFKSYALIPHHNAKIFALPSWQAVLIGQNINSNDVHLQAKRLSNKALIEMLTLLKHNILNEVKCMPEHHVFLQNEFGLSL